MISGVYQITNVRNGKRYVGSAKNLKKRQYEHWRLLKNGNSKSPHLQSAWNLYGKEAFHFLVLEYCEIENLVEREKYWIEYYDTKNPEKGYNTFDPQVGRLGMKHSPETKEKMSAAHKGKSKSPEHVEKMRQYRHSPETRAKMSASQKGKKKPWVSAFMKGKNRFWWDGVRKDHGTLVIR